MPRALEAARDGDVVDRGRRPGLRLSNLTKVFWPDEGLHEGRSARLLPQRGVTAYIVPHLGERPLTMKRMPNGIDGPFFYEKSAPSHTPDWLGRAAVQSEDAKSGEIDATSRSPTRPGCCTSRIQAASSSPHSRCADVAHPDYLFFDLDPFEPYTYEDVLVVARHIKVLLDQLGLPSFPKTSGATGLQIYVPVVRGTYSYDMVRAFVGAAGRLIKGADPDRVVMAWKVADRTGKIFIDHNMNRSGANIAAVCTLQAGARPRLDAPHLGRGVRGGFEPADFRIDNVWERFERGGDVFDGVRTEAADLTTALERSASPPLKSTGRRIDVEAPLPRTAARTVAGRTSRDRRRVQDPALFEYVRRRDFGPEGTVSPPPARSPRPGTRS